MRNFEIGLDFAENEVALVDRLQVGSEEAFETLMQLYQTPVYNIAYRVLGDPSEASDAVQDTFMKVYKGIKRFRGDCGLKTWIYKIAMSECLNRRRWWQRWRHHVIFSLDEPVAFSQDPHAKRFDVPDSHPGPELACAAKETEQAVQKALATLNFDYRIVVVLRDIEGMAYEEIAETLNVSLGTVKSRLWRGRLELKAKLQGFLDQPQ